MQNSPVINLELTMEQKFNLANYERELGDAPHADIILDLVRQNMQLRNQVKSMIMGK
jgi:heme oxygenase